MATDGEAFGQLETALRRQIKDTLDGVNSSYDKLDNRVQTIEQRLPKNLRFRLKTVEDHVKAQETINSSQPVARSTSQEYHALSAKVKSIDADVTTLLTSKLSALQSQLDTHKRELQALKKKNSASQEGRVVEDLMDRVNVLESQERAKAPLQIWSIDDIAKELLQRLAKGQQLTSPELAERLHLATAAGTTPTTETDETARENLSSQTASREPEAKTKNRKRSAPAPSSSLRSESDSAEDIIYEEPAPKRSKFTPSATRTSPRRISSIFKAAKSASSQPVTEAELTAKQIEMILQDEPRRSSRPPKPSQNPDFMTWLEVKAAKRGRSSS